MYILIALAVILFLGTCGMIYLFKFVRINVQAFFEWLFDYKRYGYAEEPWWMKAIRR